MSLPCEITTLDNGLRVATTTVPHVQSATVSVFVDVGARYEHVEENGLSHLLEHMAFKGTKQRNALAIAEAFDAIGGNSNAYTSMEQTVYYARVLERDVPVALDILADILLRSVFDEAELEREREVILQEIAMHHDTPDDLVFDMFTEMAYPEQAIGRSILGPAEQVRRFQREQVRGYMQRHYQPGRMIVAVAGKVDHQDVVDQCSRLFGEMPVGESLVAPEAGYVGGDVRRQRDLEQLHLVLGFDGVALTDADYRRMQVLSVLLGGGMSSRLFQEVREKRGLAYSVYAFNNSYRDSGLFALYLGTGAELAGEAVRVMGEVCRELAGSITEEELARAKTQLTANIAMAQESTVALCEGMGRSLLTFGRYIPPEEVIADVEAVTRADLDRLMKQILTTSMTVAALGPIAPLPDYQHIAGAFAS